MVFSICRTLASRYRIVSPSLPPEPVTHIDEPDQSSLSDRVDRASERYAKLKSQLTLLADFFADSDAWLERYVRTVPTFEYDTGSSDGERFLDWLRQHRPLSVVENDVVCCQSARFAIETMVRLNRPRHEQFQEMCRQTAPLDLKSIDRGKWWVLLNPIHVRTTFRSSALVGRDDAIPAQVIFFPVNDEIRTALLSPVGQLLVKHLSENGASRWDELLQIVRPEQHAELLQASSDLAKLGLISLN